MKKILFILLIFLVLNLGFGIVLAMISETQEYTLEYGIEIVYKLCLIAGVLFLVSRSKISIILWNRKYVFIVVSILLGYLAIDSISGATADVPILNHVLFFLSCVCVAIFEEFLFRVYVFDRLLKEYTSKKMIRVLFITSTLFALAHAGNALRPGVIVYGVLVQIVFAFGMGILFQALLFRFKNVLLIITLHAIINYLGAYKSQLLFIEKTSLEYTLSDFFMSIGIMMGLNLMIVLPISYVLLRPYLKSKKSTKLEEPM